MKNHSGEKANGFLDVDVRELDGVLLCASEEIIIINIFSFFRCLRWRNFIITYYIFTPES